MFREVEKKSLLDVDLSKQERGIKHLKDVEAEQRRKSSSSIPGDTAFFLYDSLGFPLDLTQLMAEEVGSR